MAEANGLVSPGVMTPAVDLTPPQSAPPVSPPGQPSQPVTAPLTWNGDPNTLPAELKPIYQSMQADYTTKTTEAAKHRKEAEELRERVKRYASDEQNWNTWKPLLNKIDNQEKYNRVLSLLEGRGPTDLRPQQPQQDPQQVLQKYLDNVPDDDFVQAQQLNQVLGKYKQQMQQELMSQFQEQMQNYAKQLFQEWGRYSQNFQTLVDQAQELKLQHQYGLTPKEGVEFDLAKIVEAAQSYGLTDLNAAYRLAYGEANAQRQAQLAAQQQQQTVEQMRKEAYEKGLQEGRLNQHNSSTAFPSPSTQPTFGKAPAAQTYQEANKALLEGLLRAGLRG